MVTVIVPRMLRQAAGMEDGPVRAEGADVREVLARLCQDVPSLGPHLFHASGHLKDHLLLAIGSDVADLDRVVGQGDVIEVLVAMSGGSSEPLPAARSWLGWRGGQADRRA